MTQFLWIYSARNQWFTNGHYKITVEAAYRYPFKFVRDCYYNDTGKIIHREDLEIGSHRELVRRLIPDWKWKSPEEVMRILEGNE